MYYIQSVISYFVGLALTHIALNLMETAQPALLYLVPCLLISTIVTGLFRRELKELYTGKRIQSLLDGKPQHSPASLLHGIDNPIGPPVQDEHPFNGAVINVKAGAGDDNYWIIHTYEYIWNKSKKQLIYGLSDSPSVDVSCDRHKEWWSRE